jgi:hypothetical protein
MHRGADDLVEVSDASQVTGDIVADLDVYCWWRLQTKVRIEAGHTMQPIQGHLQTPGEGLEFFNRQIPVDLLDGLELLNNHTAAIP